MTLIVGECELVAGEEVCAAQNKLSKKGVVPSATGEP